MDSQKVIAAEEVIAIATIATVDLVAQGSARTMPSPRRMVAAFLFFGILGWVSSLGQGPARIAAASGAVIDLTLMLKQGPNGVIFLLNKLSSFAGGGSQLPTPPPTPQAASSRGGSSGGSGIGGLIGVGTIPSSVSGEISAVPGQITRSFESAVSGTPSIAGDIIRGMPVVGLPSTVVGDSRSAYDRIKAFLGGL